MAGHNQSILSELDSRSRSHKPGARPAAVTFRYRPAVTFPAAQHRPLAGAKLYWLMTEARGCEQHALDRSAATPRPGVEPATVRLYNSDYTVLFRHRAILLQTTTEVKSLEDRVGNSLSPGS